MYHRDHRYGTPRGVATGGKGRKGTTGNGLSSGASMSSGRIATSKVPTPFNLPSIRNSAKSRPGASAIRSAGSSWGSGGVSVGEDKSGGGRGRNGGTGTSGGALGNGRTGETGTQKRVWGGNGVQAVMGKDVVGVVSVGVQRLGTKEETSVDSKHDVDNSVKADSNLQVSNDARMLNGTLMGGGKNFEDVEEGDGTDGSSSHNRDSTSPRVAPLTPADLKDSGDWADETNAKLDFSAPLALAHNPEPPTPPPSKLESSADAQRRPSDAAPGGVNVSASSRSAWSAGTNAAVNPRAAARGVAYVGGYYQQQQGVPGVSVATGTDEEELKTVREMKELMRRKAEARAKQKLKEEEERTRKTREAAKRKLEELNARSARREAERKRKEVQERRMTEEKSGALPDTSGASAVSKAAPARELAVVPQMQQLPRQLPAARIRPVPKQGVTLSPRMQPARQPVQFIPQGTQSTPQQMQSTPPREQSMSPREQSMSPREKSMSPREKSTPQRLPPAQPQPAYSQQQNSGSRAVRAWQQSGPSYPTGSHAETQQHQGLAQQPTYTPSEPTPPLSQQQPRMVAVSVNSQQPSYKQYHRPVIHPPSVGRGHYRGGRSSHYEQKSGYRSGDQSNTSQYRQRYVQGSHRQLHPRRGYHHHQRSSHQPRPTYHQQRPYERDRVSPRTPVQTPTPPVTQAEPDLSASKSAEGDVRDPCQTMMKGNVGSSTSLSPSGRNIAAHGSNKDGEIPPEVRERNSVGLSAAGDGSQSDTSKGSFERSARGVAGSSSPSKSDAQPPRVLLRRPQDPNQKAKSKVTSEVESPTNKDKHSGKQRLSVYGRGLQGKQQASGSNKKVIGSSKGGSNDLGGDADWDPKKVPQKLASFDELSRAFSNHNETPPLKGGTILPPVPVVAPLLPQLPPQHTLLPNGLAAPTITRPASAATAGSVQDRPTRQPLSSNIQSSKDYRELKRQKKARRLRQKEVAAKTRQALAERTKQKNRKSGGGGADAGSYSRDSSTVSGVSKPVSKDVSFSAVARTSIGREDSAVKLSQPPSAPKPSELVKIEDATKPDDAVSFSRERKPRVPEIDAARKEKPEMGEEKETEVTPSRTERLARESHEGGRQVYQTSNRTSNGVNSQRNDRGLRSIWQVKRQRTDEREKSVRADSPKSVALNVHDIATKDESKRSQSPSLEEASGNSSQKLASTRLRKKGYQTKRKKHTEERTRKNPAERSFGQTPTKKGNLASEGHPPAHVEEARGKTRSSGWKQRSDIPKVTGGESVGQSDKGGDKPRARDEGKQYSDPRRSSASNLDTKLVASIRSLTTKGDMARDTTNPSSEDASGLSEGLPSKEEERTTGYRKYSVLLDGGRGKGRGQRREHVQEYYRGHGRGRSRGRGRSHSGGRGPYHGDRRSNGHKSIWKAVKPRDASASAQA